MTKQILLRDVTESDLPIFFEHQLDPQANQMAAFPPREKEAFTSHWMKILSNEDVTKQTILVDGEVVGNIVSFEQFGHREIGYWIDRKFWGNGIATSALKEFLHKVKVRPLSAHVAKHNLGSLRVLEKCGFKIFGEDKGFPNALGESIEEFVLKLDP
jgi:RimJ/RimL family protein N-acetyltransferase